MDKRLFAAFASAAFAFSCLSARAAAPGIDAATRAGVIAQLSKALADRYVYPDRAQAAVLSLSSAAQSGAYNSISDPEAFAKALTDTLSQVLHDKHLRVRYSADPVAGEGTADAPPTQAQRAVFQAQLASENFGVSVAARLRGNVGYLDVHGFPGTEMASAVLAAMQFLANTDSMIIDMRQNRGGDPAAVALLCSYFFSASQKVHINDVFIRTQKTMGGKTIAFWTTPVTGPHYVGKPVYVLTASRTVSGGEEFAYDMQTQKRATIVGEVTGGGANPGAPVRIGEHFTAFVPIGRAINPVTKTNWEGIGVLPDIATTSQDALLIAYTSLLRAKITAEPSAEDRSALSDLIDQVTKRPETIVVQ
jgi:hypothetical protein